MVVDGRERAYAAPLLSGWELMTNIADGGRCTGAISLNVRVEAVGHGAALSKQYTAPERGKSFSKRAFVWTLRL